jgi:hypothetical protein
MSLAATRYLSQNSVSTAPLRLIRQRLLNSLTEIGSYIVLTRELRFSDFISQE